MSSVSSFRRICAVCLQGLSLIVLGFSAHQAVATTILVPEHASSVQAAIDAAQDGDSVVVAPGIYNEALIIQGKSVVLTSSGGVPLTTLTSDVNNDVLTVIGPAASGTVIEGFQISGGRIGIWCRNSGPTIRRVLLKYQNITNWGAISLGGDSYATVGVSPAIIENVTIVGCANGGISTFSSAAPTVQNTIIAFNGHYGIHREGSAQVAQPVLAYNDVFGNPVAYQEISSPGTGTIALSPQFEVGYRLGQGSPCIDAGNPAPQYNDPDGSRNDMGALPADSSTGRPPTTVRVPLDYATIQQAIDDAVSGDTILVAPGAYSELLDFRGKNLSLVSESGPQATLIGIPRSVPWPQAVASLRPIERLSELAEPAGRGTDAPPDRELMNAIYPAVLRLVGVAEASINGFTIDGGDEVRGLFAENSNPKILNCVFQKCFGGYDGGAMYFQHSAPTVYNNIIQYNYTPISGGGIFARLGQDVGQVVILENSIHDNVSGNGPAIALIEGNDAQVDRNIVFHNLATAGSQRRGAVYFRGSNIVARNNTIVGNTVGLTVLSSEDCDLRNNILSQNSSVGLELLSDVGPNANVTYDYNLVWGNSENYVDAVPGANDLTQDPLFEPSLPNAFYLTASSPCRDAGDPGSAFLDPDGSRNDIGARPFEAVNVHVPVTYHVPLDYPSIALAMSHAEYGDTILVAPGTYYGQIVFGGRDIVLKSEAGPLETVITSSPSVDLVVFSGGESRHALLEGFTLQGGRIGILCKNASPTIRRNILNEQSITNWGAISLGGGVYGTLGASGALIENNTIINCDNGGISTFSTFAPTIRNNIIAFNAHYGIHREGSSQVAHPLLSYNDVYGNPISYQEISDIGSGTIDADPMLATDFQLLGTSPCINAGDPDPQFNDPDGSRNDMGAVPFEGIVIPPVDSAIVPDDFSNLQEAINRVVDGGLVLVRPGEYFGPFTVTGKSVTISSLEGPFETVLTAKPDQHIMTFTGTETSASELTGFTLRGGKIGIWCRNAGPTIRRNILIDQNITNWGAISLSGLTYASIGPSPALIENNTIASCVNGGISTFSTAAPTIRNNIIADNVHYGIHREGDIGGVAQPILSYNDVFGSFELYQEIASPGPGAISADPLFDYQLGLQFGSPCINAGDPDVAFNDPDGSRNDMGAVPFDSLIVIPSADTVLVPVDIATLAGAVAMVNDGGLILVAPGSYIGGITIQDKSLTLRSTDGPLQTTITGSSTLDLVTFAGSAASGSTIEGFTLEGGRIGIWCRNSAPTIRNNVMVGQNIPNWGAISLGGDEYGTVGVSPATIVNNTVVSAANGAISTFSSTAPTIKNNILAYCSHYGIHREGSAEVAQPILAYNDVFGNPIAYQEILDVGVGTIAANPLLNPDRSLSALSPCIDAGDPDPAFNDPDGSRNDMGALPFTDSVSERDTIYVPADVADIQTAIEQVASGGAVIVSPGTHSGPILISGKTVNLVSTGGANMTTITAPAGQDVITVSGVEAGFSVIEGFTISGGRIGIRCMDAGPTIRRNILVDQGITNWGAISLGGPSYATTGPCPATIENNTIVGCANGAISTFSTVAPVIRNNILAFNLHYGIHRDGNASGVAQPILSYNDVFGNPVAYQEIADPGIGSISADPMFGSGYTLTSESPCINAGDPQPEFNDPDGSRNDMGALPFDGLAADGVRGEPLFEVMQNYPNPFNPVTIIEFSVPRAERWKVEVFSILGQRVFVRQGVSAGAGTVQVEFDGSDLASGVYLYRISAGHSIDSRKMLLVK